MRLVKKLLGKMLSYVSRGISFILDIIINLIETIVFYISGFLKGCLALVSMGGCLFVLLFFNLSLNLIFSPVAMPIILFMLGFLMFGGKLASYIKDIRNIVRQYLDNTANYLIDDTKYRYKSFSAYREEFKKAEEEKIRREQERYYQQQREWEERLRQSFYNQQNFYGDQGGYSQYGSGNAYTNPTSSFKYEYEKSCDVLGVSYTADKNTIKSAYRKKAKEHHPDLSKLPDATQRFQEINNAYNFLTDENIDRYNSQR